MSHVKGIDTLCPGGVLEGQGAPARALVAPPFSRPMAGLLKSRLWCQTCCTSLSTCTRGAQLWMIRNRNHWEEAN